MVDAPQPQTGVLLLNLGTPDSPKVSDVRRYLREFLMDPAVIDVPAPLRFLIVYGTILPFRPKHSAKAYELIWTPEGSPLRVHGDALRDGVAAELGSDFCVEFAMRYQNPSVASALERLAAQEVDSIVAMPLFPQSALSSSGSALNHTRAAHAASGSKIPLHSVPPFYDDPGFIDAWTAHAGPHLEAFQPDHVLLSYHGLPEHQVRATDPSGTHCLSNDRCCDAIVEANADCYRAQCFATTRALAKSLGLAEGGYTTSFQSRMGRTPWIPPFTDVAIPELAAKGLRRLAVLCPAFVADCLETLEEIGIRVREQWIEAGGEDLLLVPSLNSTPGWTRAVADLVRRSAAGGR